MGKSLAVPRFTLNLTDKSFKSAYYIFIHSTRTPVLMQGRLERTDTNLIHFKCGSVWMVTSYIVYGFIFSKSNRSSCFIVRALRVLVQARLAQDITFEISWLSPDFSWPNAIFLLRFARRAPKKVWEYQCLCLSTRHLDHYQRTVLNIHVNIENITDFAGVSPDFSWLSRPTIFY